MFRRMFFATGIVLGMALFPVPTAAKDRVHHTGKIKFTVGYAKGLQKAKSTGKPMMLYFTAPW